MGMPYGGMRYGGISELRGGKGGDTSAHMEQLWRHIQYQCIVARERESV